MDPPFGDSSVTSSSRGGTKGMQRRLNSNVYQRRRFVPGEESGGDSTSARTLGDNKGDAGDVTNTVNFGRKGTGVDGGGTWGWEWNKKRSALHAQGMLHGQGVAKLVLPILVRYTEFRSRLVNDLLCRTKNSLFAHLARVVRFHPQRS